MATIRRTASVLSVAALSTAARTVPGLVDTEECCPCS